MAYSLTYLPTTATTEVLRPTSLELQMLVLISGPRGITKFPLARSNGHIDASSMSMLNPDFENLAFLLRQNC